LCFLHDWQAWLAFGRRADVRFWAGASVGELEAPLRLRFIVVEEREDKSTARCCRFLCSLTSMAVDDLLDLLDKDDEREPLASEIRGPSTPSSSSRLFPGRQSVSS
jgi:hypothetical protein